MFSVILIFVLNSSKLVSVTSAIYMNSNFRSMHRFLSHKWYFDTVYNRLVNQPLLEGAYRVIFALIDKGLLETMGPTGFSTLVIKAGNKLAHTQTGRVYDYA